MKHGARKKVRMKFYGQGFMVRAMCGVKFRDIKIAKYLLLMLGFIGTIDLFAMAVFVGMVISHLYPKF